MLDATSAQKVVLLGNDYKQVLTELIPKENLEERFGGSQPNKTSNFFPPALSETNQKMYTVGEALQKLAKS